MSKTAIKRALREKISKFTFKVDDLFNYNYNSYDSIIALEVIYYLTIKKTVKLNIYQYSGKNIFEKFIAFFLLFIYSRHFLGIFKIQFLYQILKFIPDKYIFKKNYLLLKVINYQPEFITSHTLSTSFILIFVCKGKTR